MSATRQRMQSFVGDVECGSCGGSRLRDDAAAVRFRERHRRNLSNAAGPAVNQNIKNWKLDRREKKIAGELIREVSSRVQFLNDVGLEYLTLAERAASLVQRRGPANSTGQPAWQRTVWRAVRAGRTDDRLPPARQHAVARRSPTARSGQHADRRGTRPRSDREQRCDLDFGPKAGSGGGQDCRQRDAGKVAKTRASVTGPYLSGKKAIPIPSNRRPALSLEPRSVIATGNPKASRKRNRIQLANTLDIIGAHHQQLERH